MLVLYPFLVVFWIFVTLSIEVYVFEYSVKSEVV